MSDASREPELELDQPVQRSDRGQPVRKERRRAFREAGPPTTGVGVVGTLSESAGRAAASSDNVPLPPVSQAAVLALQDATSLIIPVSLEEVYAAPPAGSNDLIFRPDLPPSDPMSIVAAFAALSGSVHPFPANLLPLAPVDDRSIAAVVCDRAGYDTSPGAGLIVRWHIGDIPPQHQAAILDTSAAEYIKSVLAELKSRSAGLDGIDRLTKRFREHHVRQMPRGETSISRPKAYEVRPVQLACQNVVVGMAAFAYQSQHDALDVRYWQTCEASHLATAEATRALTAMALCEAFATGSTMELRFSRHPERRIPAAIRRYARANGIDVGVEDRAVITPREARDLFLAVTPMSDGLRSRATRLFQNGSLAPERLCYLLMAGIWTDLELDFMVATTWRAPSILAGGAPPVDRISRSVESEVGRAALMVGMLQRRLDLRDDRAEPDPSRHEPSDTVKALEDDRVGMDWAVDPDLGVVTFLGYEGPLPWIDGATSHLTSDTPLVVMPRAHPTGIDTSLAQRLAEQRAGVVALLTTLDRADLVSTELPVLRCPDRVSELDTSIEAKLLSARVSRG